MDTPTMAMIGTRNRNLVSRSERRAEALTAALPTVFRDLVYVINVLDAHSAAIGQLQHVIDGEATAVRDGERFHGLVTDARGRKLEPFR